MEIAIDKELWDGSEPPEAEKWSQMSAHATEGDEQVIKTFTYCGHAAVALKGGRRPMFPFAVLKCDGFTAR